MNRKRKRRDRKWAEKQENVERSHGKINFKNKKKKKEKERINY